MDVEANIFRKGRIMSLCPFCNEEWEGEGMCISCEYEYDDIIRAEINEELKWITAEYEVGGEREVEDESGIDWEGYWHAYYND